MPLLLVGGMVAATAASADPLGTPVTSKSALAAGLSGITGSTPRIWRLTQDLVTTDTAHDSLTVPAGTVQTIDLAGKDLSLDTVSEGAGARLTVTDSSAAHSGHLIVDGVAPSSVPLVPATQTPGIDLGSSSTLVVDGAHVEATGGAASPAIGATAVSTATGQHVVLAGAADVVATGGTGAAGIAGALTSPAIDVHVGDSARLTSSGGAGSGIGAVVDGLRIDPDAVVIVPSGSALQVPAASTVDNAGVLQIASPVLGSVVGGATSTGTLHNTGNVVGIDAASVSDLTGLLGGLHLTGATTPITVTPDLAGGSAGTTPTTTTVLGSTVKGLDGWAPVKAGSVFTGWNTLVDGTGAPITGATDLSALASTAGVVSMAAQWATPIAVGALDHFDLPVGVPASVQLPITGTDPAVTILSGTLPDGLSLSNTGLLTGTPTTAGTQDVVVSILGPAQTAVSKTYTFAITGSAGGTSGGGGTGGGTGTGSGGTGSGAGGTGSGSGGTSTGGTSGGGSSTGGTGGAGGSGGTVIVNTGGTGTGTGTGGSSSSSGSSSSGSSSSGSSGSSGSTGAPVSTAIGPKLPKAAKKTVRFEHAFRWVRAAAGTATIRYSIAGKLPKGVRFGVTTGALAGAPKQVGTFRVVVTATNAVGHDSKQYTLVVPKIASVIGHRLTPKKAVAGAALKVAITRLKKGEHWTLKLAGKVVGRGTAKGSTATTVLHLPTSSAGHRLVFTGRTSRVVKDPAYRATETFTVRVKR